MVDERLVPLDYQEHDIQDLVAHDGTGLVVSAPGGRKTLVAVETAMRCGSKTIMVIAPAGTLRRGWTRTILRQDPNAIVKRLDSTKPGKAALADLQWGEPGWYLCTPQWFARQLWKGFRPDHAIFDEIHIAGAFHNKTRIVLHGLQAERKLGLSGTPLRNNFENAWGIVRWIYPDLMPLGFWEWRRQKCKGEYDRFAPQKFKVTGELVPGELMNSLPCYLQHLARERCCEFHPKGFLADLEAPDEIVRMVEMSTKQKKFYTQMEKDYVAWLTTPDEDGKLPVVAELPITARNMLRFAALGMPSYDEEKDQLYFENDCDAPKLDAMLEDWEKLDFPPAIIYTHSRRFASVVTNRLIQRGHKAFQWSGGIRQKLRDDALEEFIDGSIQAMVAVITAVGTGTDGLQEATNLEFWLSEDEDGTANTQARSRVDRPGQDNQVLRFYYRAEGTHDEGVHSRQLEKALEMASTMRKRR